MQMRYIRSLYIHLRQVSTLYLTDSPQIWQKKATFHAYETQCSKKDIRCSDFIALSCSPHSLSLSLRLPLYFVTGESWEALPKPIRAQGDFMTAPPFDELRRESECNSEIDLPVTQHDSVVTSRLCLQGRLEHPRVLRSKPQFVLSQILLN